MAEKSNNTCRVVAGATVCLLVCAAIVIGVVIGGGYYKTSTSVDQIPEILPPLKAAAPQTFVSGSRRFLRELQGSVDPNITADAFTSRFFSSGPSDLWAIVQQVDERFQGYNSGLAGHSCVNGPSVAFDLGVETWGETVTLHAQCADSFSDTGVTSFVEFGWPNNDTIELLAHVGAGPLAARLFLDPVTRNVTELDIWATVVDPTRLGSNGVVRIHANPITRAFEMTAAGTGLGFCGAQLVSDGVSVWAVGSIDMCACQPTSELCFSATDSTQPGSCGALSFSLPALGRTESAAPSASICDPPVFGASYYPGGSLNTISVSGYANDSNLIGPQSCCTTGVGTW